MIFNCNSTWSWCYALWSSLAFPHEPDATLYDLQLQFHTSASDSLGWGGVGWGGIITSLAFPHELDATLYDLQCEKKLRLPFLRLKWWKGCHSQSRRTLFFDRFWMQKLAPRCEDAVILIIFARRLTLPPGWIMHGSSWIHTGPNPSELNQVAWTPSVRNWSWNSRMFLLNWEVSDILEMNKTIKIC